MLVACVDDCKRDAEGIEYSSAAAVDMSSFLMKNFFHCVAVDAAVFRPAAAPCRQHCRGHELQSPDGRGRIGRYSKTLRLGNCTL